MEKGKKVYEEDYCGDCVSGCDGGLSVCCVSRELDRLELAGVDDSKKYNVIKYRLKQYNQINFLP